MGIVNSKWATAMENPNLMQILQCKKTRKEIKESEVDGRKLQ